METIGRMKVWTLPYGSTKAEAKTSMEIRKGRAHEVSSYLDLAKKIAELQFNNKDHVLLFRGQPKDYRRMGRTTLKPTIFRPTGKHLPDQQEISDRYGKLKIAELKLIRHANEMGFDDLDRLERHRMLRWSVLQHYEICPTPLLDVTHSLRVAASFASDTDAEEGYLFVLGVPNLSGAITASNEAGLQIVRLSSVCPPSAVRPHIQEGYLLGEYPDLADPEQKTLYGHYEIDFGRRLVAKFRFNPKEFWSRNIFPKIGRRALYPNAEDDPLCELASRILSEIDEK